MSSGLSDCPNGATNKSTSKAAAPAPPPAAADDDDDAPPSDAAYALGATFRRVVARMADDVAALCVEAVP